MKPSEKNDPKMVLFKEVQQFNQWWLWLLLVGSWVAVNAPLFYGSYIQFVEKTPWGNQPMSDAGLIAFTSVMVVSSSLLIVLFAKSKLLMIITRDGISFRFSPLMWKRRIIQKEMIDRYEVRTYRPVIEYGGWGIKKSFLKGRAYTVSGNLGLQLYLKGGKKILIGTQQKSAVEYALRKMMEDGKGY